MVSHARTTYEPGTPEPDGAAGGGGIAATDDAVTVPGSPEAAGVATACSRSPNQPLQRGSTRGVSSKKHRQVHCGSTKFWAVGSKQDGLWWVGGLVNMYMDGWMDGRMNGENEVHTKECRSCSMMAGWWGRRASSLRRRNEGIRRRQTMRRGGTGCRRRLRLSRRHHRGGLHPYHHRRSRCRNHLRRHLDLEEGHRRCPSRQLQQHSSQAE